MREKELDHLLEVQKHRLTVDERDHVHAEAFLHLRVLEEVVQNHFGHRPLLEVDRNANLLGRLVAHLGDAFELFVTPEFVHALVHDTLIDHVRNLVDNDAGATVAELFQVRLCTHDNTPAAGAVALMHARETEDDAARRKVRSGHKFDKRLDRAIGIF